MLTVFAGPAWAASAPIEGTRSLQDGQVLVQAEPGGSFEGVVVAPVTFSSCSHPAGQVIWQIHGSGFSYTATLRWFHGDCSLNPGGESTWKVNEVFSQTLGSPPPFYLRSQIEPDRAR